MFLLGSLCVIFLGIIIVLAVKILLMRKSAREIQTGLAYRLEHDTNTLLTVSSQDKTVKNLADSLNEQLLLLRNQRRRFQGGDLELKEAVTNLSHDLRTPLTAICAYLELAAQEEKTPAMERYLEIINERAQVMKQLTEELFRYSVVLTEYKDSDFEKVCLNAMLEESLSAYYAPLKANGITPVIVMPRERIYRSLNRNALSRILGNIISNAVKYSDGDFRIELLESGEMVFTNHAPALDETQAGKLFDRFYTVEAARKSTGLGLSIARALTEQMKGEIYACWSQGSLSIHLLFPGASP